MKSEWIKTRSLRSNWVTLVVGALLTVGLAGAFGYGYEGAIRAGEETATRAQAVDVTYLGIDLLALILGVFGVLQATGEYGQRTMRSTLTAVPRRWPVLAGKGALLIALLTPITLAVSVASFVLAQAFLGDDSAPVALRPILGAALYPVAAALMGLGIGLALRHSAGAITVFVSMFLIIPALLPATMSQSVEDHTLKYLPLAAAQALYTESRDSGPIHLLSPSAGAVVLTLWVAGLLAVGGAVLLRRDA
ncbi:ABC transporter permease subunit [Cryptosporangium phraense]|uniref:ABC transporter permease subunit n=1 Tax=Cryptosporangium phraense TaxID=2593070 RepID=A0A545AU29_9ACTN|nr:ABC transporter permease subunit [Cryptosporangium phraense]TQS44832.1 ABC transporter permease subunit [Cryptosporangium phraense]